MEGRDGSSVPRWALPIFWLALIANGNFVAPRGFTGPRDFLLAAGKGLAVVGSAVAAFKALPQYRVLIGLSMATYAVYFRFHVLKLLDPVWKVTSPLNKQEPHAAVAVGLVDPPASVTVAGFRSCLYHRRALAAAQDMASRGLVGEAVNLTFKSREEFQEWLLSDDGRRRFGPQAQTHSSSPFVWTSHDVFIGGCEDLLCLMRRLEGKGTVDTPYLVSSL